MNDHRLAIGPREARDGSHLRAAIARAVAGAATVHMTGVEAEWAVIPVLAAANRRPDKGATVDAFKGFATLPHRAGRAAPRRFVRQIAHISRRHTPRAPLAMLHTEWRGCYLVIMFVVIHGNVLLASRSVRQEGTHEACPHRSLSEVWDAMSGMSNALQSVSKPLNADAPSRVSSHARSHAAHPSVEIAHLRSSETSPASH
jgi:hypothetical protein